MIRRLFGWSFIAAAYWATLYAGYRAGKRAAADEFKREDLERENKKLKEQLKNK